MNNKQQNQKDSGIEELALLGLSGQAGTPGSSQDALAAILVRKFAKEQAEDDREQAEREAFREATLANVATTTRQREATQLSCPHMKPNFRPATGGQWDHSHNYHFICQYCGKEFGNEIPGHLRIPADAIGGPQ